MENGYKAKVVIALIEKNGKFLLIRRAHPAMKLEWAFPGGVTKMGETENESVIRETVEEVGLDVEVKEKLLERKHPNTLVPIAYFDCLLKNSQQVAVIGEPDEIAEIEWVNATEVLNRFTSDTHQIIRDFVTSKAKK
jgi:mutator protein MutT